MRRWFLIALIALLPLRGWAGDAMAVQMLVQQANAMESIAAGAHQASSIGTFDAQSMHEAPPHAMPADCPGHAAVTPVDAKPDAVPVACEGCAACQLCHLVALAPLDWGTALALLPLAKPLQTVSSYLSAERAPGFKPPIS